MQVVLVDDHALFRDSLKSLMTARGYEVVGETGSGREAVELARRLRPDLVLMDVAMSDMDGLTATRLITSELEDVKVVMLTASTADEDLFEAIKAGAEGYLHKEIGAEAFLDLLDRLARGEPALTPGLARKVLGQLAKTESAAEPASDPDALTARETEVLETMVAGLTTNRQLAEALGVSENTIKFHVRNILDKLHLHNRTQAVAHALRHRLVPVD